MYIGPPQELYPDPPPAYEACYSKATDTALYNGETTQQPIQEQPRTAIRVSICGYISTVLLKD